MMHTSNLSSKKRTGPKLAMNYIAYSIVCLVSCTFILSGNVYASEAKVVIVNGTSNHCLPYPSCYRPYQVNISLGDTVTWLNEDNRTHTVTTGTTNYGPKGVFDSGSILPGQSYTQFFGTAGKYQYYDKQDMWPSGIVVVGNGSPSHAELNWVENSLSVTNSASTQGLVISKKIQNTGNSDASSIIFRLKIYNQTGFLFFDNLVKADIGPKETVPINFVWETPSPGVYRLNFDADAANVIGDTNENNDVTTDIISLSQINTNQNQFLINENSTLYNGQSAVPEFGPVSYLVLTLSIFTVLLVYSKYDLKMLR